MRSKGTHLFPEGTGSPEAAVEGTGQTVVGNGGFSNSMTLPEASAVHMRVQMEWSARWLNSDNFSWSTVQPPSARELEQLLGLYCHGDKEGSCITGAYHLSCRLVDPVMHGRYVHI